MSVQRANLAVRLLVAGAAENDQVRFHVRISVRQEAADRDLMVDVEPPGRRAALASVPRSLERRAALVGPSTTVAAARRAAGPSRMPEPAHVRALPLRLARERAERLAADHAQAALKGGGAEGAQDRRAAPSIGLGLSPLCLAPAGERAERPRAALRLEGLAAPCAWLRGGDRAPSSDEVAGARAEPLRAAALSRLGCGHETEPALLAVHAGDSSMFSAPCEVEEEYCRVAVGARLHAAPVVESFGPLFGGAR